MTHDSRGLLFKQAKKQCLSRSPAYLRWLAAFGAACLVYAALHGGFH